MYDAWYYWRAGNLMAYIELLKTGIRDICLPHFGMPVAEDLDPVDIEAKKHGFGTLLVSYKRAAEGRKYRSYQRIIYVKGRRRDAELLKKKLQKTPKNENDHRVIGRLLGYSDKAIEEFVKPR